MTPRGPGGRAAFCMLDALWGKDAFSIATEIVVLATFGTVLLLLCGGYIWADIEARRRDTERTDTFRPAFRCLHCGRRVELAATLHPIRRTLLCPEAYRHQYGGLAPLADPLRRYRASDSLVVSRVWLLLLAPVC